MSKRPVLAPLEIKTVRSSYPVHFFSSVDELSSAAGAYPVCSAAVVDESVMRALPDVVVRLIADKPRLLLPSGETTKTVGSYAKVLDFLAASHVDRRSVLWVIGGGVTGDTGGFAAATYLRGIAYVQVPTTLLAMVDSSVGGKTGINLAAGKNLAGAIYHPRAVLVCGDFLRTLPPREFAAGMAEVIKYGMLGDIALFQRLEAETLTATHAGLFDVIRRCCELKAAVVAADENETAAEGGRALLNLGHTFGHAIENVAGYGAYLHGEAVAVGLAGAARLSQKLGQVLAADVARVERVLTRHALPVKLHAALPMGALMQAMQHDKKNREGRLRFVVLQRLGEAATRSGIDAAMVQEVWRELGAGG